MVFQKRSRSQGDTHRFTIGKHKLDNCTDYTYLGLKISSTGSFNPAINELREKARRAFYAIKRQMYIQIPISIWLKLFQSVIEPILLYGSEVWGPLTYQNSAQIEKHPIEIMHLEFCKSILRVHRRATNNACRAELGQFPSYIKIYKRVMKYWIHLKNSDPDSYQYKALQSQEMSKEKSPFTQLVLTLRSCPNFVLPQNQSENKPIRVNQIIRHQKQTYITNWNTQTKTQSKMQCYLDLKREYRLADYLTTVTNTKYRNILTKYRLSEHSLAIETGRYKQSWLPKEERFCQLCKEDKVETELHFLTECTKLQPVRTKYFPKFRHKHPQFNHMNDINKIPILLGEHTESCSLAAEYVFTCHTLRDSE